jgi:hypothetical protein
MRYVLLFLIISFAWAADPPEVKLPPEVQKIVDAREAEVAKAKAVYDAAVSKATAAAAKKLEAAVTRITRSGDLKGALAAQAVLDKWNGEAGDLLGEKTTEKADIAKIIIGKQWISADKKEWWEFTEDFGVRCSLTDGKKKYKVKDGIVETFAGDYGNVTLRLTAEGALEKSVNGATLLLYRSR